MARPPLTHEYAIPAKPSREDLEQIPRHRTALARHPCTWMYGPCFCLLKDILIFFNN
jgi:hypothetical protein